MTVVILYLRESELLLSLENCASAGAKADMLKPKQELMSEP